MRCLGLDFGERRIGLSYGDDLGVATPLPAITADDRLERLAGVESVVKDRRVTDLVVGYPLNMDGTAGFKAREVDTFISDLIKRTSLPVHRIDERLTTQVARAHLPLREMKLNTGMEPFFGDDEVFVRVSDAVRDFMEDQTDEGSRE